MIRVMALLRMLILAAEGLCKKDCISTPLLLLLLLCCGCFGRTTQVMAEERLGIAWWAGEGVEGVVGGIAIKTSQLLLQKRELVGRLVGRVFWWYRGHCA